MVYYGLLNFLKLTYLTLSNHCAFLTEHQPTKNMW